MPESLKPDAVVLRRFNPNDKYHWSIPDGAEGTPRLRSAAFDFLMSSDGMREECSVYEDEKLAELKIQRKDCLESSQVGWDLAASTVRAIRTQLRPPPSHEETNPFDVVPHAYPDGVKNAPRRDGAHAEIVFARVVGTKPKRKWRSILANAFERETIYPS